jgi:hypothetical protein
MKLVSKPKSKKLSSRQRMLREYFSNAVLIATITESFRKKDA